MKFDLHEIEGDGKSFVLRNFNKKIALNAPKI